MILAKPRREVDEAYKQWIVTFPCLVRGRVDGCSGDVDPDHSIPKSLGGSDRSCVPLCRHHHQLANRRLWFEQRYAIVFKYEVEKYNRLYEQQHPNQTRSRATRQQKRITRNKKQILRAYVLLIGTEFSLPVFESIPEAHQWMKENRQKGRIVRCRIEVESVK